MGGTGGEMMSSGSDAEQTTSGSRGSAVTSGEINGDAPDALQNPRREFLRAVTVGALAAMGGVEPFLTPRQAWAKKSAFQTLSAPEVATLEEVGEVLVPGSRAAGLAYLVDRHVTVAAQNSLLEARILNVRPPFLGFYRSALEALNTGAHETHGQSFIDLADAQKHSFVEQLRQAQLAGWLGAHGPSVYFVLRSDAVDAVYGTMEGYAALGVPYMPHIAPDVPW